MSHCLLRIGNGGWGYKLLAFLNNRCAHVKNPLNKGKRKNLIWDKILHNILIRRIRKFLKFSASWWFVFLGTFRSFSVTQAAAIISREILQGGKDYFAALGQTDLLSFLEIWNYPSCLGGREEQRVNLISLAVENNPVKGRRGRGLGDLTIYLHLTTEKLTGGCF